MATTAQHVNVERTRRAYEAFAKGDMQVVGDMMADNIVWHVPGAGILAGDYRGKDAVFGFFGKLMQETGGTFKIDVHDILANGEHSVALVTNSGDRNGKHIEWRAANISHADAEGRMIEFWGFPEDTRAVDEFFS